MTVWLKKDPLKGYQGFFEAYFSTFHVLTRVVEIHNGVDSCSTGREINGLFYIANDAIGAIEVL